MKRAKILFFLGCLMFFTNVIYAQTKETKEAIEQLICKEWKVAFYEVKEIKNQVSGDVKNDRLIFYKNHKIEGTEEGVMYSGTWKYDENKNTITTFFKEVPIQTPQKIFKLTENEFVLESVFPDGTVMKTYMITN
jgi:hypothetical protein